MVPQNCLRKFGRCDSDAVPKGPSTADDKRPMVGKVYYGIPVVRCRTPGTVAITYDDGPSANTHHILNILKEAGANATFFVTGINNGKGEIDVKDQWKEDIKRMEAEGHQIASHTWSHPDLDKMTAEQRHVEMHKNERALANIIGKYPTYMRAPYIKCGKDCLRDMKELGYKVIQWSVDSTDTEKPKDLDAMKEAVDSGLEAAGSDGRALLIQHDTVPMSAIPLTRHILARIKDKNLRAVTVADCLGETLEDAYRKKEPVKTY